MPVQEKAPERKKSIMTRLPGSSISSVERAMRVLRVMSEGTNTRLTDIAAAADLDKATALRLLEMLVRDGFVVRDPASKQFALGPELMVLGAAALRRFDPRPLVRPSVMRLVGQFEDSVVLSIPSGIESLCIEVEEGSYPIRANYLRVGSRRPLGVGAGSLALLAWMPQAEREAALEVLLTQLQRYPRIDAKLLHERIDQAREKGYAVLLDVVVERMGGIAAPIFAPDGKPVAAISIAALNERILSREAQLAQALQHEARICQVRWAEAAGAGAGQTATKPRAPAQRTKKTGD
ncbi:IclR family transcriptional regulator [Comamonas endophytica]|uniref:IclR family transcriptional regulator n=1 Tax=Comamonas endophytica TaxID=2949090 RepID=A0ABY6GE95_9BURK|nr:MULTISPECIES: IclR family transcriptional regulator [unclassified Acidovorax]MCD2513228.1 IclR family transcriptional regulator [Acidovorax sp. D4N7]UYG53427.1 IclR family transcriptional regulator [Acidovorax sp. 5MLIR]